MSENIVFLDRETIPSHITIGKPKIAHHWFEYASTTADQVVERSKDAHVLITNKVVLNAQTLAACPALKLIIIAATGTNNLDLTACKAQGIAVYNITHYANEGVPEHALTLMLALLKNLIPYHHDVRAGKWQAASHFCFTDHPIQNLAGKTLGIIGGGALGTRMAVIAQGLGMRILLAERKGQTKIRAGRTDFEQVVQHADIITLHCPLTESNQGLFSYAEFAQMKPSAYLINTARGPLVDENALAHAILNKQIAGAASDVAATEPLSANSPLIPLLDCPNFILTPHVAWASDESLNQLCQQLVTNIDAFYLQNPHNRIV